MAIRIRKILTMGEVGFYYVALCAVENKYEKGDIYLNDNIDHALRIKFLEDYKKEGLVKIEEK
ncbi:hypothetical protein ES703_08872 [subsurface metagenome]